MIKEFYDLTGFRILIYNADNFLKYAKEKQLIAEIKDKTIEEVKETLDSNDAVRIPYGYIDNLAASTQLLNVVNNCAETAKLIYADTTASLLGIAGMANAEYIGLNGKIAEAIRMMPNINQGTATNLSAQAALDATLLNNVQFNEGIFTEVENIKLNPGKFEGEKKEID